MTAPPIQLAPRHWEIVAAILERVVPRCEVWAFGSRATGEARDYSDLDLAVAGDGPLSLSILAALTSEFEDSALPFKVDVVDWHSLSPEFRQIVRASRVRVKPATPAADEPPAEPSTDTPDDLDKAQT